MPLRIYPQIVMTISQLCLMALVANTVLRAEEPIDFGKQVAPILNKNCSACHNSKKPEGGLVLESFATLMKGGDSGPAVVAKSLESGELLSRIMATDDTVMPPDKNAVGAKRLTPEEIAIVKSWIAAGAPAPTVEAPMAIQWRDIGTLSPIYASDISADNRYLAYGLGNTVVMIENPLSSAPTRHRLLDANLKLNDQPLQASHLDLVQSLAFSPDSQRLATGGYRSVKIWKRQTESTQVAGLPADAEPVALSLTQSRVAVVRANDVQVYACDTNQLICTIRGHAQPVTLAAFSPDEQVLFTTDSSGLLLRSDLSLGHPPELQFTKTATASQIMLVARDATELTHLTAPTRDQIIGLRGDGKLYTAQRIQSDEMPPVPFASTDLFKVVEGAVAIATLPTIDVGPRIAVARGGAVEVLTTSNAQVIKRWEQGAVVQSLALSHDGQRLAVSSVDGVVKIWNIADGALIATSQGDYQNTHRLEVAQRNTARQKSLVDLLAARVPELQKEVDKEAESQKKVQEARTKAAEAVAAKVKEVEMANSAVAMTQQGIEDSKKAIEEANKRIETLTAEMATKKKAVEEMEKKQKEAEAELAKHDQALATATDGLERAKARVPEQTKLVEAEKQVLTAAEQQLDALKKQPAAPIVAMTFGLKDSLLATASSDNQINLVDTTSGRSIANLKAKGAKVPRLWVANQQLVARDGDQYSTWDISLRWQLERTLGDANQLMFSDRITSLDFSPDGKQLAIGSGPPSRFGDVKIYDVDNGQLLRDLGEVHSDTVFGVRFSPNGRQLATCGADKLCKLFQVDSGQLIKSFEGHTHHVLAVAWQDNGQRLATASADNTVKTWNVESGERLQSIEGFGKEVSAIEFLAQTDQIATASVDGQTRIHNSSNKQVVRGFGDTKTPLYALAVTSDAQHIVAAGQNGTIWVWKAADGQQVQAYAPQPEAK